MATLEEIVVQLTAETAQLRAEMASATKAVSGATEKMDKAISEFSNNSSKKTSFFQQSMATMTGFLASNAVLGAFGMLKDAAGFLADALKEGAESALKEEEALTRLGTSLKLSGNYSKTALNDLAAFAGQMEELTGIGDDVVASNLAVLSSLTKLNSSGLQAAQQAAIDLSAALGKDLSSTTEMVAKAINGNDGALRKLGITLNLTEDSTQNLAVVTEALTQRFGGAAAAKMNTFGGALLGLQNAYGNMIEEISKSVTSNDVFIAVMREGAAMMSSLTSEIAGGGSAVREGLGRALLDLLDILISVGQVGDIAMRVLKGAFNAVQVAAAGLIESIIWLYDKLSGNDLGVDFSETKKQWEETKNSFSDTTVLGMAADKLTQLRAAGETAFENMKTSASGATAEQEKFGNAIQTTSALTEKQAEILKSFAQGLADQNIAISSQFEFANQMLAENHAQRMALVQEDYAAQIEAQTAFFDLQAQLRDEQYAKEQEQLAIARANNLITDDEYNRAKIALGQNYALENAKQQTAITQFNAQQEKTRQENFKSTMGTIAGLASSGNRELAAIGKAAAITQATIDGYAAVQKALASAPPPFNFGLAALVGAATAANVAKIAGVGLKNGITEVPRSAGGGNLGDNFPAVLNPGERVVPAETNQDLKEFLANRQSASSVNVTVTVMPGTGLNNEQIGNLVEQLNNYFGSGGQKLLGAT